MGRKDRERFRRLRETNPDYNGYRGFDSPPSRPSSSETETLVCSLCQRRRNVAIASLPDDINEFVCLSCQEDTIRSV